MWARLRGAVAQFYLNLRVCYSWIEVSIRSSLIGTRWFAAFQRMERVKARFAQL